MFLPEKYHIFTGGECVFNFREFNDPADMSVNSSTSNSSFRDLVFLLIFCLVELLNDEKSLKVSYWSLEG